MTFITKRRLVSLVSASTLVVLILAACSTPSGDTTTVAPTPEPEVAEQVEAAAPTTDSGLSAGQQNAIESAENYLSFAAFSQSGLIGQLEFEGYSTADATFAVESLDVDWNEQAAKSADNYLETMAFSLPALIDQLEFEGFTPEQAAYGANQAYDD